MDRHCCDILDGVVVTICYYLISMETTSSVGGDCQGDGQ
jgi:hypothetical protein